MRFALLVLALFVSGCVQKTTPSPHPVVVNIESLYRAYRDAPDMAHTTWTGHRVRITLLPRDYQTRPDGIHWFDSMKDAPAVFVFVTDRPPLDNSNTIEIIGVCRGRQNDGIVRGPLCDWHIRCDECTVTVKESTHPSQP